MPHDSARGTLPRGNLRGHGPTLEAILCCVSTPQPNTTKPLAIVALALWLLVPRPGLAVDTAFAPFPGIRHVHRESVGVDINVAVVDLCAPGVSVRHTDFSERRQTTSSFARSVGAQWAINADFSCRPIDVNPNTSPFPPCIGQPAYMTYGIAAHAGQPWPRPYYRDALLAFGSGRVEIYDWHEHKEFESWMGEALSGHWSLVVDGQVSTAGEMAQCDAIRPLNPSTAIGLSRDRTKLVMAVADGRNGWRGATCSEMGALLVEFGAYAGFGLDGGGSTTMWSSARGVLNHPSDGSERVVGPHLAIYASGAGPSPYCDRPWAVDPAARLPSVTAAGPPARFNTASPARLFDTRHPSMSTFVPASARDAQGRLGDEQTLTYSDFAGAGVPADAAAVVLNLTATGAAAQGYATAFPGHLARPDVSTLNFTAAQSVANLSITGLGAPQRLSVFTYRAAHFIGDLAGYFAPTGAGFVPEGPTRLLDTRSGEPLRAGVARRIVEPAQADVTARALGLVAVGASVSGFITTFPCHEAVPNASSLNYETAATAASVIAKTGPQGICAVASSDVHLLVDTTGTFRTAGGLDFVPLAPTRVIDTRQATGRWIGRIPRDTVAQLALTDAPGFPADARAVVVNVTAVDPVEPGFISLYPCNAPRPDTSSLNFTAGRTVANLAIVPTGGGSLCAYTTGRTHLLIDLVGLFVPPPSPPAVDAGSDVPDASVDAGEPSADASTLPDAAVVPAPVEDAGPADASVDEPWAPAPTHCACAGRSLDLASVLLVLASASRRRRSRVGEQRVKR